ncbi:MAG: L-2-amino-thiazoline-4-carboxylic acid hydrolase [Candidatus Heimdallarchaeota archaeon]
MPIQKYGEYNPNLKIEFYSVEFVERALLARLNHLLGFLLDHNPEIHNRYLLKLKSRFESLVQVNLVVQKAIEIEELGRKYDHLLDQPEIITLILNYGFWLLNLPKDAAWESQKVEISEKNYLGTYLLGYYQLVLVLAEIMGKEEAIKLLKDHIDQFYHNHPRIPKVPDLERLREMHIEGAQDGGEIRIISDVHDGKLVIRKDSCLWAEIMKDLNDPELAYIVACYGDFKNCSERNQNFVLTRNYTIVEGFPYCDEVIHDTRIVNNLGHPPKEYFDNLWPLG